MSDVVSTLKKEPRKLSLKKIIIISIAIIVLALVGYKIFKPKTINYQFVNVERGTITETVAVTGNTTPSSSVTLGFGNSGNIARINSAIGQKVTKGQVLAELNISDLQSQIRQAQANVATQQASVATQQANVNTQQANVAIQQAKLDGLQAGSRPEDIASAQAALEKAQQDLSNMYTGIRDTSADGYAKANDAVRVQLEDFFTDSESYTVKLNYITANTDERDVALIQRADISQALDKWQAELSVNSQSDVALNAILQDNLSCLSRIRELLDNLAVTLQEAPALSAATLTTYKAGITVSLNEINTATKSLNTILQNIASQKLVISQLQAQLNLKKAGATAQDIAAQQAQVESTKAAVRGAQSAVQSAQASVQSAQASVQSAQAKLQNSQIVAPIDGVITQFDAKVGQFAAPGAILISIISENSFEVDALVSEIDVSKVALGNKVSMTLDAFSNETFNGSVFYIDPAQTASSGVVGYKIKVAFDKADERMKSGLTANIDIETRHKDDALIVPQSAILQNDAGTFVEVLKDGVVNDLPVVIGLRDQNGNVEVISGVTDGQQVLNVGLKK
jgi:HlyD family secretion protein